MDGIASIISICCLLRTLLAPVPHMTADQTGSHLKTTSLNPDGLAAKAQGFLGRVCGITASENKKQVLAGALAEVRMLLGEGCYV
jgi:hypothetical protein